MFRRLMFVLTTLLFLSSMVFAQIPRLISYQGYLTDDTEERVPVPDGRYTIVFRIYDAEFGGTMLWIENQSVDVENGLYSTMLGSYTPLDLPFDEPYWLQIEFNSILLTPRYQLGAAPYALNAPFPDSVIYASEAGVAHSVLWSDIDGIPYGLGDGDDYMAGEAAGGDLTGTYPNPGVARLRGIGISVSPPVSGQVLKFDGLSWGPASDLTGGASGALNDLTDVNAPSPATGEVIKWNGSSWANAPDNAGGGSVGSLSEVLAVGNSAGIYDIDLNNNALLNIDWFNSDNGSGSLLDADFLDGEDSDYYLDWDNFTDIPAGLADGDDYMAGEAAGGDLTGTYPNPELGSFGAMNGQVLKWNSGSLSWEAANDLTGGAGGNLDDLGDVNVPAPAAGEVLKWNGAEWTNAPDATGGGAVGSLADVLTIGNSAGINNLNMNNNAILNIDWATSDDGAGSLLDADLLDGQHGTYYLDWSNFTGVPGDLADGDDYMNGEAAGADLDGTYPNPQVVGLRSIPLSSVAPSPNQILKFNGIQWAPAEDLTGGAGGGIGGSGTADKLAIWEDDSTIGAPAPIYWDETDQELGLGTPSPTAKLDIRGTRHISVTTDGILNIGDPADRHITLDNNEIHARNGSAPAELYINDFGGFVYIARNLLVDHDSGFVSIGNATRNEKLTLHGVLSMKEGTPPSSSADFGKLYVKGSDSRLYFMDDGGTEYDLLAGGGGGDNDWAYSSGSGLSGEIYHSGDIAAGEVTDPDGYGLYVQNYSNSKAAVRGTDQSGTIFAEGQLGVLAPNYLPYNPVNIGVLGIKPDAGENGVAIYGWNNDTNEINYALYAVCDGAGVNNYGIYSEATGATNNYAGYFNGYGYFEAGSAPNMNTLTVSNPDTFFALRLLGPGVYTSLARLNWGDGQFVYLEEWLDDHLKIHSNNLLWLDASMVGIGIPNPFAKVQINTNSFINYPQVLLYEDENEFARLSFMNTSGTEYFTIAGMTKETGLPGDARLNFYYSETGDLVTISGNGNVGIGTSEPAHRLEILNDINEGNREGTVHIYSNNSHYSSALVGVGNSDGTPTAPYIYSIGIIGGYGTGPWPGSANIGTWGHNYGAGSSGYGVVGSYGADIDTPTNWGYIGGFDYAGYFQGKGYFTNNLGVGVAPRNKVGLNAYQYTSMDTSFGGYFDAVGFEDDGYSYGVYAKANSYGGGAGPEHSYGVYGTATSAFGTAFGGYFAVESIDDFGVCGVQGDLSFEEWPFWVPGGLFIGRNGVAGFTTNTSGYGVVGINTGGGSGTGTVYGVYGKGENGSTAYGVYGTTFGSAVTRYGVYASGNLGCSGTKPAVVATSEGPREMYAMESPNLWFEDFGIGIVNSGQATIALKDDYLETVTINDENPLMVYITPLAPLGNWWVENTQNGFILNAPDAPCEAQFNYRVVAKRKLYEDLRMKIVPGLYADPFLYPDINDVPSEYLEEWLNNKNGGQQTE
ncbi:hypothetical protein JW877_08025 [bacterium]|nr:hypothetical protein [bacterium]